MRHHRELLAMIFALPRCVSLMICLLQAARFRRNLAYEHILCAGKVKVRGENNTELAGHYRA